MSSKVIDSSSQALLQRTKWLRTPISTPTEAHLVAYGAVSFLVPRDKTFCAMRSSDLKSWFMPPILTGQYTVFSYKSAPRALATWACMSDEATDKFAKSFSPPPLLDWVSGENIWIMSLIAPYSMSGKRNTLLWLKQNIAQDYAFSWRSKDDKCQVIRYGRKADGLFTLTDRGEVQNVQR